MTSVGNSEPQPDPKRPRFLTVVLVVIAAAMIALSATLTVMYAIPLKSVERTDATWSGANLKMSAGPSRYSVGYYLLTNTFCGPTNEIGNLSVSVTWQSSGPVNTSGIFWQFWTGAVIADHFVDWANNTTESGYSFAPALEAFLCEGGYVITCGWSSTLPGVEISLSVVRAYNYSTSVPIW